MTSARDYYQAMAERGRLAIIMDSAGERVLGGCSFFVVRDNADVETLVRRPLFELVEDYPNGEGLYIDTLWALHWDRAMRLGIEEALARSQPQFVWAAWYRPSQSGDRRYTIRRRLLHV